MVEKGLCCFSVSRILHVTRIILLLNISIRHFSYALTPDLEEIESDHFTFPDKKKTLIVACGIAESKLSPFYRFRPYEAVSLLDHDAKLPSLDGVPSEWHIVLVHSKDQRCVKHPFYVKAVKLFNEAPLKATPKRYANKWIKNVYFPDHIKKIHNRPLIIRPLGEVFWKSHYGECTDVDAVLYRSRDISWSGCRTFHYIQGISHGYRSSADDYVIPIRPLNGTVPKHKGFCVFVVKAAFQPRYYNAEGLVRQAFHRLLSEYKTCDKPGQSNVPKCEGTDLDVFKCFKGYKFSITMENTQAEGYLSEKLFNGVMGDTVPVYHGAPDIYKYVNSKRILFCNVSKATIRKMNTYYERRNRKWVGKVFENNPNPSDEELISWATEFLRDEMTPCVNEVIRLDNDDDAYQAILKEPFLLSSNQHP
eukprot:UC4_evm1s1383